MNWPEALLLSIVIEAPLAALGVWLARWGSPKRAAFGSALGTLLSHPLLWLAALALPAGGSYWPGLIGLELLVVLGEAALIARIARLRFGQALQVSLLANAASLAAGLLLRS